MAQHAVISFLKKCEAAASGVLLLVAGYGAKAAAKSTTYVPPDVKPAEQNAAISMSDQLTYRMPRQVMPASEKTRIFIFTAEWCEACKGMKEAIPQAQEKYGHSADIQVLDIDDPENSEIVERLNAVVVPAMVCVSKDGIRKGETIGFSSTQSVLNWMGLWVDETVAHHAPATTTIKSHTN